MNPLLYSLCQKPVIGFVLWMSTGCWGLPPVPAQAVSLNAEGLILSTRFSVSVDKRYPLNLVFTFEPSDALAAERLVGTSSGYCVAKATYDDVPESAREEIGRPIPLKVVVRRQGDGSLVLDQAFKTFCVSAWGSDFKTRRIVDLDLARGDYLLEVTNLQRQTQFDTVRPSIAMHWGSGKN